VLIPSKLIALTKSQFLTKQGKLVHLHSIAKSLSADLITPWSSKYHSWLGHFPPFFGHMTTCAPVEALSPLMSSTLPLSSLTMKNFGLNKIRHKIRITTGITTELLNRNQQGCCIHYIGSLHPSLCLKQNVFTGTKYRKSEAISNCSYSKI